MALTWRPVGKPGEPYPDWLRAAAKKSGVYAIRVAGWFSPTVVYVGESHTGNLGKTLTRHFQAWGRGKTFWRGQYAPEQTDPGHTYRRADCEVAIQTAPAARALALQERWIRTLKPRDNRQHAESIPF